MEERVFKDSNDTADHRVQFFSSLDEDSFRQIVLIPLLTRLGYREVIEYHGGSTEKGKDILCWYNDPMEYCRYVALVVKKGDIHGSVGKRGSASEILYQIQQAFNEPYRDIYDLIELRIDECIIATTGKIKNTAIESISGSLRATNLDRIIKFVDGYRLIDLITRYMPEYWLGDQLNISLLHEMRSVITSVSHSAYMLSHYYDKLNIDKVRSVADRIVSDAEIAQQLAERQWIFRTKEIGVHSSRVVFDKELIRIVDELRRIFESRMGHKIDLNIEGKLGSLIIDLRAFRQVMFSILDNAVKYSHRNKKVEIIACNNGSQIIIRVRNYGFGISRNFEELIFQPYYTASPRGPGLGLFIARKLLLAMDGDIRVTQLEKPTEISIYLNRIK